jgi:O-antigen ligase
MSMNRDESDLRFTIKWIYVGLIAEVAWSLVQFVQIYIYHFRLLDLIQKTVMMAGLPPNGRISGLALEPSWLAAQVITLYLPWAFAALLKGYDWGGRRWMTITILAVCAFLLTYTFSRAGVLTALAALILTFLIAGRERIRQAWRWFTFPLKVKSQIPNKVLEIGLRMVVIAAVLAGLTGGTYILSRNRYFATIWHSKMTNLTTYFVDIYAGPRLAYSWAGWNIFTQHPWTGVGLGAAGFYLPGALPDWAHFNNPDISSLLSPTNQTYPNTKDLYIRLLSETGILGFWSFLAFYLLAFGKVMILCGSKRKHLAFLGAASLLAWISILTLGFTQDSLAMPVIWVPLGILMGMIPTDSGLLPQPAREGREPAQQEKA